jgi:hypothetical protein
MMPLMRTVLNGCCWFTVAASSWLGVMFVVLHRPGYERGLGLVVLFILQSLLTLAVTTAWLSAAGWRLLAILGAAGITWAGGAAVINTLNRPHFEGYALVIGVVLVLQGVLTAGQPFATHLASSSKVHLFGN